MTELKPCPFCGGNASYGTKVKKYLVSCTHCLASSDECSVLEQAINEWNTRQPQGINWQPITQLSARQGMYAIFTSINRAFAINSYKLVATEWEAQYLANHYTHFIEIVPPEV